MKNKTQQLKEKIAELVPELISGCDCKNGYITPAFSMQRECPDCNGLGYRLKKITLEDVLMALREKYGEVYEKDYDWKRKCFNKSKDSDCEHYKFKGYFCVHAWTLNQPLENQSEETINFLFEMLND